MCKPGSAGRGHGQASRRSSAGPARPSRKSSQRSPRWGVGSGFRAQGSGFRVQGSGFRVQGSGFRVQGSGFRVQGSGFRVQGSGFRVQGSRHHPSAGPARPPRKSLSSCIQTQVQIRSLKLSLSESHIFQTVSQELPSAKVTFLRPFLRSTRQIVRFVRERTGGADQTATSRVLQRGIQPRVIVR